MNPDFNRESGVLLHITSLPGPYGVGEIGESAFTFIDALEAMGQHLWQILPLNPPDEQFCPYSSISAFAFNPLLLSLENLTRDGLLKETEVKHAKGFSPKHVDFRKVIPVRRRLIETASERFLSQAESEEKSAYTAFCEENISWLEDFTCYSILRILHEGRTWRQWPAKFVDREPSALAKLIAENRIASERIKIQQFLFFRQWKELREYANVKNVKIVGDVPIYVAYESADVWAHSDLFKLKNDASMIAQSGCPPDIFLDTGQLWGHPTYKWVAHEASGFRWWIDRVDHLKNIADILRIDHFNGFVKYWEVPAHHKTGEAGAWHSGPGELFFDALFNSLGSLPIIAEDLGEATMAAASIREKFNIPGMKILQMSFNDEEEINKIREKTVVYTGTHDNDTSLGWFRSKQEQDNDQIGISTKSERQRAMRLLGTDCSEFNWDLINVAMRSKANTVIIPLQDVLGLDSSGRMNTPGKIGPNWTWRF